MIESTIGGITFSTESSEFTLATLDGWYSGPPTDAIVERRPNSDGAFGSTRDYKSPRILTQTGLLFAADAATAITELWPRIASLQADGEPLPFTVTDASGVKSCVVSLMGSPVVDPIVGGTASYVLQMVARDPVKYGPSRSLVTGLPSAGGGLEYELGEPDRALSYGGLGGLGRVTLTNGGTAEVWPSFEVLGELTAGFTVQNLESGATLRYDRIVPSGSTVLLDSRTGEVLVDRVSDGSTYLTRNEWFSVAPGGSVTVQFNAVGGSAGGPVMSATIADGFW